jgi:hypothetical protein
MAEAATNPALARHLVGDVSIGRMAAADIAKFLLMIQITAAKVEANVAPRLALGHLVAGMPVLPNAPNSSTRGVKER